MKYITASGAQIIANTADGILVQVNTALTGTIKLSVDGTTFASITNPLAGDQFRYNGLRGLGPIIVNPSATTDITISFLNRNV